jgi:AAA ATPase domain
MHQAIRAVGLVVVVGTPQMRSSRLVKEQLRIAQMYQRRLVLLWAQGNDLSAMLQDPLWAQLLPVEVIDARGTRYPAALEELLACLQQNPLVSSLGEVTYAPVPEEPRNPYKGLRAFTQQDVGDFFGRDALIQDLLASLKDVLTSEPSAPVRPRLLTLLGPSGSGKSSVLLAGLLPQLKSAALPMSNEWVYLEPIMPGNRPLEALQLALASHFPERSGKAIREDLEEDSARGLHLLARQLVKQPTKRVLLVIDQFEEVFTQTSGEQERQRFIDLLVTAATEPKGPMVILLTLRTDFYERLLSYPDLFRLIEHQHHVVLPMQLHELRAIIEQPAALPDVQVTFEGQLVGDLLFEAQGQVGALPLLEFTLDQLFQQRSNRCLTLAAYQQLGGIKGALAKHAEATYAALPSDEHRKLARALFLRLIEPGISEQDSTRRRARLSELFLPDARQTSIIHEVAEAFVGARLLTTNELAGTSTIEVSHEALIREWKRLSEWLREAREDIRLQQTISEDAMEWRRHGKSNDRLYRGSQLAEATEWVKRNVASSEETDFLQTSVTRERQARSRRNLLVGVTSLVLLVMLVAALILQGNLLQTQARLLASLPVSVTNLNDHGPGSLRQAIATAPSGSAITFAKNLQGTIQLTSGELMITKNVVISGPGADFLAISGGSSSRVFDINQATVTISNLTIKNSHARINGEGRTGTSSGSGGGIFIHLGSLVLLNSIVTDNTADSQGGGIYNLGTLTLIDSTVSNNMSGDSGGGLLNYGTLTLTNSTVVGNVSQNRGGGIYNDDYSMLTLTNATISGNKAVREGGGLFGVGDTGQGQFALVYCTVYDNTASTGGGIVSTPKTTVNTMAGSIVADNHALSSPDIAGALLLSFPNLVQNPAGATFVAGDSFVPPLTSLSPQLGPLHNNAGATPTHALLAGSPAIDQIPYAPSGYATICGRYSIYSTDQRGVKRPQGKKCDIGAYEYVSS